MVSVISGKIRRGGKRKRTGSGRAHYADFVDPMRFKPVYCVFDPFERVIVMAVILFRGRHRQNVYALFLQPFHATFRHIIFRVVAEHSDNRSVRRRFVLPINAVKSVFFNLEPNLFHNYSLKSILTICIFIKLSPAFARNLKNPLTDLSFKSL